MRILLFPACYLPVVGGLQTASHQLAQNFQKTGHTVRVATQRYPRSLPVWETLDGVSVQRWLFQRPEFAHLRRFRPDLFLEGLFYMPVVNRQLQAFFEEFQPEVVNVHFPDSQTAFVLKMRQSSPFKLIVSLHGHDIERWRWATTKALQKSARFKQFEEIIQVADAVTACSHALLDKAILLSPEIKEKSLVIHNGIDLSRFMDRTVYPHPRPYILAYGRLNSIKGFDLLLQAFAQAARDLPEIDLVLAGDGEEKEHLHKQAIDLAITGRVKFFGQASPQEIVRLLNGAYLVIVPSRQESFGLAALEAMAAGKPVLATRVGGIPEFLPEYGNILVAPDAESIGEGLVRMINNPKIGMQNQANRQQAARFTWEEASRRYLQVYAAALQTTGKGIP
jgi:glycosyltransferase involved in cell wall biosynthesis